MMDNKISKRRIINKGVVFLIVLFSILYIPTIAFAKGDTTSLDSNGGVNVISEDNQIVESDLVTGEAENLVAYNSSISDSNSQIEIYKDLILWPAVVGAAVIMIIVVAVLKKQKNENDMKK